MPPLLMLLYYSAASTIVITAPHGGTIKGSLPDRRTAGCYDAATDTCTYDFTCSPISTSKCDAKTVSDFNTQRLAEELADKIENKLGVKYQNMHNYVYICIYMHQDAYWRISYFL